MKGTLKNIRVSWFETDEEIMAKRVSSMNTLMKKFDAIDKKCF